MKITEVAQNQMENLIKTDNALVVVIGATLSPILSALYGEKGTQLMILVFGIMILDLVVGTLAAKKEKIETSEYGLKGLIRIAVISCLPIFGHQADQFIGAGNVMFYALAVGIAYHTLKSFGANLVRIGWDKFLPMWMLDLVLSFLETEIQSKKARSQAQFQRLNPNMGVEQPLAQSVEKIGAPNSEPDQAKEEIAIDLGTKG